MSKISYKDMYPKLIKGVIGSYFELKELYPWPKHSLNISIKKVIGNDMEGLKVESKLENLHAFCPFMHKMTSNVPKTCKFSHFDSTLRRSMLFPITFLY